jgi:hypothetical protein
VKVSLVVYRVAQDEEGRALSGTLHMAVNYFLTFAFLARAADPKSPAVGGQDRDSSGFGFGRDRECGLAHGAVLATCRISFKHEFRRPPIILHRFIDFFTVPQAGVTLWRDDVSSREPAVYRSSVAEAEDWSHRRDTDSRRVHHVRV